jgi:hypothetical protein
MKFAADNWEFVTDFSVDTARPRQLPRWRHLGCMIDESSKRMGAG